MKVGLIAIFLVSLLFFYTPLISADNVNNISTENLNMMIKKWSMYNCKKDRSEQDCTQELIALMMELSRRLNDVVTFSYTE